MYYIQTRRTLNSKIGLEGYYYSILLNVKKKVILNNFNKIGEKDIEIIDGVWQIGSRNLYIKYNKTIKNIIITKNSTSITYPFKISLLATNGNSIDFVYFVPEICEKFDDYNSAKLYFEVNCLR